MKKMIMKLLGLDTLVAEHKYLKETLDNVEGKYKDLCMAQDGLRASLDEVTEKVEEIEIPDMDDYLLHSDLDDNIESYLNNNDYVTQSYVDDEVENKVSDAVESAVEDLDIEEKVRDLFNDASPAPMSEQAIKDEVNKAIAEVLSKAYDHIKKQG